MTVGDLDHPVDAEGFHREWFEVITSRQLLSHSAGTPHGEGGEVWPLFFEPGTEPLDRRLHHGGMKGVGGMQLAACHAFGL